MANYDPTFGGEPQTTTGGTGTTAGTTAEELKRKASDAASQVRGKAADIGRSTVDTLDRGLDSAAEALTSGASTLRNTAQGNPTIGNIATKAADKMERAGTYMREHDVRDIMSDVEGAVRRNPGPSLLIAAAFGFLMGTAIRGSGRDRY